MKRRLRSQDWFGKQDKDGFIHRSWLKNQGYPDDMFDGRPVIGICNTWSELTPCNGHFREIAEFVKRGVLEAGGFPLEFPVMSLGETQLKPTAMLFRNLASMDVEESIRGNPMDGVVLLMGCDKTTPSLLMGAASCDLPTIGISGGPMLSGRFRGKQIGSGTGVWQMSEDVRAGKMSQEEFTAAESCMHRSKGHCMTMGTASTMASMVEALGVSLPGNAAIPAVDSRRYRLAQLSGRRIVEMVREDLVLSKILTRQAFENAIKANAAIGGSTNSVVHLLAIAGRLGVKLELEDWDKHGSTLPCLVNLQPSGQYLMEDFYYAGGLPAVLQEIAGVLNQRCDDRQRQDHGREHRECAVLESRRHQGLRRSVQGQCRHRDPARQPRARWRGHQALGRDAQTTQTSRPGGGVRDHRRLQGAASTTRVSRSTRTASWCSRVAVRRVIRAWPRSATWRCRRRSCARASPTWCASPMRA